MISGLLLTIYHKLAECSHLEAELDSIAFGDPFDHPESIICDVIDLVVKDPFCELMH